MQKLDTIDCEGQSKEVVGDPVLLHEVPNANNGAAGQGNEVMSGEFVLDQFFVLNFGSTSAEHKSIML